MKRTPVAQAGAHEEEVRDDYMTKPKFELPPEDEYVVPPEHKVHPTDRLPYNIAEYVKSSSVLAGTKLAKRFGCTPEAAMKALAKAALGALYPCKGLYAENIKVRQTVIECLTKLKETGKFKDSAPENVPNPLHVLTRWLSPFIASFDLSSPKYKAAKVRTMTEKPEVIAALTVAAVENIEKEREIQLSLQAKRTRMASKLYDIASELWDKVLTEARRGDNEAPATEDGKEPVGVRGPALKAMAEAAHNALRDAQLVAGQATDRVEGFLTEISSMSVPQLIAFLETPPDPRALPERTDAKVKIVDAEYEVSEDEPE